MYQVSKTPIQRARIVRSNSNENVYRLEETLSARKKKLKKRATSISSPADLIRIRIARKLKKKKKLGSITFDSTQFEDSFNSVMYSGSSKKKKNNLSHNHSRNSSFKGKQLFKDQDKTGMEYIRQKRKERLDFKKKKLSRIARLKSAKERSNNLSLYMCKFGNKIGKTNDVMSSIQERVGDWINGEIARERFRKEDVAVEKIKNWYFKMLPQYKEFQKHWDGVKGEKYGIFDTEEEDEDGGRFIPHSIRKLFKRDGKNTSNGSIKSELSVKSYHSNQPRKDGKKKKGKEKTQEDLRNSFSSIRTSFSTNGYSSSSSGDSYSSDEDEITSSGNDDITDNDAMEIQNILDYIYGEERKLGVVNEDEERIRREMMKTEESEEEPSVLIEDDSHFLIDDCDDSKENDDLVRKDIESDEDENDDAIFGFLKEDLKDVKSESDFLNVDEVLNGSGSSTMGENIKLDGYIVRNDSNMKKKTVVGRNRSFKNRNNSKRLRMMKMNEDMRLKLKNIDRNRGRKKIITTEVVTRKKVNVNSGMKGNQCECCVIL